MSTATTTFIVPDSWTNQGPTAQSASTYSLIETAFKEHKWPDGMRYELYLQGSYKNSTNIRGDSDVDVVAEMTSVFKHDVEALSSEAKARFDRDYADATITLAQFKAECTAALTAKFGSRVTPGKKCINVGGEGQRLNADVVPAQTYRKYNRYIEQYARPDLEGIRFHVPSENRWVINFPKAHYENGVAKHAVTGNAYKPLVRVFKHARNKAINDGLLQDSVAPSYFIECLLYNLHAACFTSNATASFRSCLGWIASDYNTGVTQRYMCQNGETQLFGTTPEHWRIENLVAFYNAMMALR